MRHEASGSPGAPKRLNLLRAGFFVLGFVIVSQLFRVQVMSHHFYAALADGQHDLFRKLFPERGRIFAREKGDEAPALLATNRKLTLVFAEPFRVKDARDAAVRLAPILELESAEIEAKISDRSLRYKILKRSVSDAARARIETLGIEGIRFSEEESRYYPEATTAAHLLGFLGAGADGGRVGQYGIEGWWNGELSGEQGYLESEKDSFGRLISVGRKDIRPARNGDDLVLTVDRAVSHVVCGKLDEWVAKHGAEKGSAVILEPATGRILAMCSSPVFDPNVYGEVESIDTYNNQAIFAAYEPGSIFKPIGMAAALDTGKVTPTTPFDDSGEIKIGPFTIRNSDLKAHGRVTMTEVLTESLNTGMVDIAHRLGPELFLKYVRDFGFGQRHGIELETESAGDISSLSKKGDIWSSTGSFGQGITVTPLQIAAAYGAIANGGVLMRPTVIEEIRHPDGKTEKNPPKMVRRVISERAAKLLSGMLTSVVEKGHGRRAAVDGYWVAGKTGTAQIAKKDGGGYEADATIGSFAGFAPLESPRFAMIVRIDRPKDVQFAESSAAPLFGDIAKFLLDYYEIAPTRK
jgi:cell division protein FtsI/penicillin-binding protein 2